jgi:hypothetical protein
MEMCLIQAQRPAGLASTGAVLSWEKGRFEARIPSMPAIVGFLGYYPFPDPTTVGERLLRRRREEGWSIKQAVRRLRLDRGTWGAWEQGELILSREHRSAVASRLRLDQQELETEMRGRWNGTHGR